MDDVLINKGAIIERCLVRVAEEYAKNPARLENFTHQDAIILNLERACRAAIDMAMRLVARDHLGVPQSSAGAFDLLARAGRIPDRLASRMRAMVGFRNVAVHQYRALDLKLLREIVEGGHKDFAEFCSALGVVIKTKP